MPGEAKDRSVAAASEVLPRHSEILIQPEGPWTAPELWRPEALDGGACQPGEAQAPAICLSLICHPPWGLELSLVRSQELKARRRWAGIWLEESGMIIIISTAQLPRAL